jgi:hypothetical protein
MSPWYDPDVGVGFAGRKYVLVLGARKGELRAASHVSMLKSVVK